MKTIMMEVGRLYCGELRWYLQTMRFRQEQLGLPVVTWLEGRGLFTREWIICIPDELYSRVAHELGQWCASLDLDVRPDP